MTEDKSTNNENRNESDKYSEIYAEKLAKFTYFTAGVPFAGGMWAVATYPMYIEFIEKGPTWFVVFSAIFEILAWLCLFLSGFCVTMSKRAELKEIKIRKRSNNAYENYTDTGNTESAKEAADGRDKSIKAEKIKHFSLKHHFKFLLFGFGVIILSRVILFLSSLFL